MNYSIIVRRKILCCLTGLYHTGDCKWSKNHDLFYPDMTVPPDPYKLSLVRVIDDVWFNVRVNY